MDSLTLYHEFQSLPFSHEALMTFLKDFKNPNDQIHQLIKKEKLISLRKGLYILSNQFGDAPSPILMANHIYGPSYVSLEYMLEYYGAIPEAVYEITSITNRKSNTFENSTGRFTYHHVPDHYYSLGISIINLNNKISTMVAGPEKSLLDKIVTTSGINLRSKKDALNLLIDDLRIDLGWLRQMDLKLIVNWIPHCPKKESINQLVKAVKEL